LILISFAWFLLLLGFFLESITLNQNFYLVVFLCGLSFINIICKILFFFIVCCPFSATCDSFLDENAALSSNDRLRLKFHTVK
jgi:hypothetical protein